jgi:2-oxoglutarate ferredoxin oxidoreductase subunit alpha
MAVGAASVGARSVVGTSGGGFALMEETVSLAGITETPLLIAISQRPGPATGVPTGTAQADLNMARNAGHGEFPRIVLAPGDVAESFELGGAALNLAWQFQTPVLFLLDKHVSESLVSADFSKIKIKINRGKLAVKVGASYDRYQITKDGVSPLAFAGAPSARVKINSYEHDEHGLATEDLKMIVAMADKRLRKTAGIEHELKKYQPVKVYGDKKSTTVILFWGSTKGAVLEAMKYAKKPVKAVQVLVMEPFPTELLKRALKPAKKIIAIEANATGQLAQLAQEKCGVKISRTILRYDGRPFAVEELVRILR